jgi:RNA polymerase sigma-70 factor (ECF subfamily)
MENGEQSRDAQFTFIWQRYYAPLVVFCRGFAAGGGTAGAEDLAQEILLKVYARFDSYDRSYSPATWIYRIARNHCIDHLRRTRRGLGVPLTGNEPARAPGPDLETERTEARDSVSLYIEGLPGEDRQIAFLRFYEELPYREISRTMGIPEGTAKYRVHVIRKGLRKHMEERGYA